MSGSGILLDSVILIDHLGGHAAATRFVQEVSDRAYLSAITRAEVLAGLDDPEFELARQLLDHIPLIAIDQPVADLAARLRRRHRWRLPDAIQAAAAVHHGLKLATRNTRDFDPRRHDFVVVPYTL